MGEPGDNRLGRDLLLGDASAEALVVALSPVHLSASTLAPSCAKCSKCHRRSVLDSVSIDSALLLASSRETGAGRSRAEFFFLSFFSLDINADIPFPSGALRCEKCVLLCCPALLRAVSRSPELFARVSSAAGQSLCRIYSRNYLVARILRQLSRSRQRDFLFLKPSLPLECGFRESCAVLASSFLVVYRTRIDFSSCGQLPSRMLQCLGCLNVRLVLLSSHGTVFC